MGRNKDLRERIAAQDWHIEIHERKIAIERQKSVSNEQAIAHWQAEIRAAEKLRARLMRRLDRDW